MRELSIPAAMLVGMGLGETVAMITDGRYSARRAGPWHRPRLPRGVCGRGRSPRVREGDLIEIDIPNAAWCSTSRRVRSLAGSPRASAASGVDQSFFGLYSRTVSAGRPRRGAAVVAGTV